MPIPVTVETMLLSGVSPGSGGPGEVKRNSHVSLVSGGKEDSAMQSSEIETQPGPGSSSTPVRQSDTNRALALDKAVSLSFSMGAYYH